MVFEYIEKLKRAFTDKYVVVDATQPELARFRNATGLIKTVNMNGRALVEFDQFDNIGWYDIELDFLKVVPKPEPKAKEEKPAEKKASAEKPAAASKTAVAKPAAAGSASKASTADILAAARAKKGTGETATATTAAAKSAPAAKPAPAAAAPSAKATSGKPSTSDILAMARGKGAATGSAAAPPQPTKPAAKKEQEPAPLTPEEAEEPTAEAAPVVEPNAKPVKTSPSGPKPTTIAEKIAYCRQVDTK
jgi:hypothetical protein